MEHTATIVGWYGTETVGDKAILGGIMHAYREKHPDVRFTVASLNPFLTRRTMKELGLPATVIANPGWAFVKACLTSDAVIMGGGPLMGIDTLWVPLWAFVLARLAGRERIVWGCGLGPLDTERHLHATRLILRLATDIRLRDEASVAWARDLTGRDDIVMSGDAAQDYAKRRARILRSARRSGRHAEPLTLPVAPEAVNRKNMTATRTQGGEPSRSTQAARDGRGYEVEPEPLDTAGGGAHGGDRHTLACFLRDWSPEYRGQRTRAEFDRVKQDFEDRLGAYIRALCARYAVVPVLHPMHTYTVGGDDRIFARRFLAEQLADVPGARYAVEPSTVDSILQAMLGARLNICMRFHSVLFAHTARTPFLAIDYTNGGKIKGFLEDCDALHRRVALEEVARGHTDTWEPIVERALGSLVRTR
jgi:polysaccharide pyruvyl transferase WcaK-like protein